MNGNEGNSYIRPLARTGSENVITVPRAVGVLFATLIYAALSADLITDSVALACYSLLLLAYLYVEAKSLWVQETHLFAINPIVLASIFTFAVPFGVSNILFFMPENEIASLGLLPGSTPWMNQLMLLVLLGACAMWVGYSSGIGRSMAGMLQRRRVLHRWILSSVRINTPALFAFLGISILARLLAIQLEVYGYAAGIEQLIAGASYLEYIAIANSLGRLALVGVTMQACAPSRTILWDVGLLALVLGIEITFGFLAGFKSAVVMPVIIVGVVYYSQRNRFPLWFVPAVVIAIVTAYLVIEPFRATRKEDLGFYGTSVSGIIEAMPSYGSIGTSDAGEGPNTALRLAARLNLTYLGSLGIEYAANYELREDSPSFLEDIFLAPVYAVVPRVLWESKPLQNLGTWYTDVVVGAGTGNSTGMGPFTYLNFAGGPLAVLLGFFIVGIFQRGLFDGLRDFGGGGLFVLLGLLETLASVNSSFNSFFVAIIRYLPLLVVAQSVMLKRTGQ